MSVTETLTSRAYAGNVLEYAVRREVSQCELANMEMSARVLEHVGRNLVCELRAYIAAINTPALTTQWPATWWQALKAAYFPGWMLRRWPIRYTTETFHFQVLYPELAVDRTHGHFAVQVQSVKRETV